MASVVAIKFDYNTRGLLVEEPKAAATLHHSKVVTRTDTFNDASISPCSSIFDENDPAFEITIVNLELYVAEGDTADRSAGRYFSCVEITFDEFRLNSNRRGYTGVIN